MFTGIVQQVGVLARRESRSGGARLVIRHAPWAPGLALGESVCVQGACLTVIVAGDREFRCDVLRETLDRTALGAMAEGARVNLERALRAGDLLGGHFVTGHVDGTGTVAAVGRAGPDWRLRVRCAAGLMPGLVAKGSVACDGVSLTVAGIGPDWFEVHIIPHTWDATTLGGLSAGRPVNVETDIIGKYVLRHAEARAAGSGVTMDVLRNAGFPV
jgi:riboflavin synthase